MVHDNDAMLLHIAVNALVMLLEILAPDVGLHKQTVLGAPVVVGQNHIGFQIVHQQFGVLEPIFRDGIHQIMHVIGLQQQIYQRILKAHQVMALFKNARAHKAHGQILVMIHGGGRGLALLPALGAVGHQIGHLHCIPPAGDIGADLVLVGHMGHGAGGVLGEQNLRTPLIHRRYAALAVAAGVLLQGVVHNGDKGFILTNEPVGLSVAFQGLQQ